MKTVSLCRPAPAPYIPIPLLPPDLPGPPVLPRLLRLLPLPRSRLLPIITLGTVAIASKAGAGSKHPKRFGTAAATVTFPIPLKRGRNRFIAREPALPILKTEKRKKDAAWD